MRTRVTGVARVPPWWMNDGVREDGAMANLGPMSGRRQGGVLAPPVGQVIARYSTYLEAQRAVDFLSDNRFPVQAVTIVGTDLRTVERVTGRLTYGRVALAGALSGAWFGLFVGLLLSLFADGADAGVLAAILIGAGFGMLFGVISFAATGGRRDFTSQSAIVASEYQVLCRDEQARAAIEVLGRLRTAHPGVPPSPPAFAPPRDDRPPEGSPEAGDERPRDNPYAPPPPGYVPPVRPPSTPTVPPEGAAGVGSPGASSGVPGGVAPRADEDEDEPAPTPVGPTYGEVMEQRRREQRAREAAERARRAAERDGGQPEQ